MIGNWKQTVQNWLRKTPVVSLELPDGWFGRPGDDIRGLTYLGWVSGWLLIKLDQEDLLVLREPISAKSSARELIINFSSCFFDWKYSEKETWQLDTYSLGRVRFVGEGASIPDYFLGVFEMNKEWKDVIERYFTAQGSATALYQRWLGKLLGIQRFLVRDAGLLSATVLSHWIVLELSGGILLVFRNLKRVEPKRRIELKRQPEGACDELVITGYTACIYDRVGFEEAPSRPLVFTGGEVRFLGSVWVQYLWHSG